MKKTVVVTGATGAIGKATALALAKNNCKVILIGRNQEKLSKVRSEIIQASNNNEIETVVADLSEPRSIKKAVSEIKSKNSSLNALVNVAAIFKKDRIENSQGFEYIFATNHLGPFILTNELLDLLKAGKPSKIITVSAPSTTHINFEDIHGKKKFSAGFLGAFGASKMMNLMFTYAMARRLEGTGVTVNAFHPGLVKSELTKEMPKFLYHLFKVISSPPEKAATMLSSVAIDGRFANLNGTFITFKGKEIKSNSYSYNKDLQEKLWTLGENLASVK